MICAVTPARLLVVTAWVNRRPLPRWEAMGTSVSVVDALVGTGLAPSRAAARRTIKEGGAYLNNE